jgi:hypothetical protein
MGTSFRVMISSLVLSLLACVCGCPSTQTQSTSSQAQAQQPVRGNGFVSSVRGATGPGAGDTSGEPDRGTRRIKAVQSTLLRSAIATAASDRLETCQIRLYSGASKGSQDVNGSVGSLTGTLIATWWAPNPAFSVTNGVATLLGVPLAAVAEATAACSAANNTSCYIVFIAAPDAGTPDVIEVIASASLTGGGGEMVFDVQPQSGGVVNLTGYTRTFPAGT